MAKSKKEVQDIANRGIAARFSVPDGTREELVAAIAAKLRTDKEIVWIASRDGISAICVFEDQQPWRPRTRFFLNSDEGE
jgi:hypothetical protein